VAIYARFVTKCFSHWLIHNWTRWSRISLDIRSILASGTSCQWMTSVLKSELPIVRPSSYCSMYSPRFTKLFPPTERGWRWCCRTGAFILQYRHASTFSHARQDALLVSTIAYTYAYLSIYGYRLLVYAVIFYYMFSCFEFNDVNLSVNSLLIIQQHVVASLTS